MRHRLLAGIGAAVLSWGCAAGVAAADDAPPPPPVLQPPATPAEQTRTDPVGSLAGLLATGSPAEFLSQGGAPPGTPAADPLAAAFGLLPQNYRMPSGEEQSPYVLQTGVPPGPFARVDAFKGVHALIHGGLGRMPGADLGQPLPGIAPPPGTVLPPGLEQFYVDPTAVVPPDAATVVPPDAG